MGKPATSQDIVTWAEQQTVPAKHKGKGYTLSRSQVQAALDLHKLGKTQTEIAQTLGCDQATISRWLKTLTDSTELAGAYLRGKALDMAKNVVRNGQARDHIAALKGLKVLAEDSSSVKIAIGISLPGMPDSTLSPTVTRELDE
jgi:transposase-like protein